MSFIGRVVGALGYEKRSVSSKDPYMSQVFGLRDDVAGQTVTPENATGIAAIHACVQLIAETVASLPLAPYKRESDGGKTVDTSHPLYNVLHDQANRVQSAFEFREQFVASCLFTGNGYALKVLDGHGAITELVALHPGDVTPVKLVNGRIRYEVRNKSGGTSTYIQDEILHLRYRSADGFTGLSPIALARNTISIALAQQAHEGATYKNGGRPSGALQYPHKLNEEQKQLVRESWSQHHQGSNNSGRLLVLEDGMEFKPISMSHTDAQFVENKKLTLDDIARIYRIPPPAIGILSDATYSNITEQSRSLVMHTLRPWLVRIEQAMNNALLTPEGRRTHLIEHNAEGLLRGNQKERYEAYRMAREWGWLNVNEIRRIENMGGVGVEGDTYRQPMNSEHLGADNAA